MPTKYEAGMMLNRLLKLYRRKCDGHLTYAERQELAECEAGLVLYFHES